MADLAITVAQVISGPDADFYTALSGDTITAGMSVYLDELVNRIKKADANASISTAGAKGIALHAALPEQPIKVQTSGSLTLGAGAAPVVGTVYLVSPTAGGIAPAGDAGLVTGCYITILGVGGATNTLKMNVFVSNQAIP